MKSGKTMKGIFGSAAGIITVICLFLFRGPLGTFFEDTPLATASLIPDGKIHVEYLDVGQADAILIRSEQKTMLIDAGNNEDGTLLTSYLKEQGVSSIDVLIGTHPHEDHIGGMDDVIREFRVEKFILPDVITTTKTFTSVLDAAEDKNLKITTAEPGINWRLGDAACEILCCEAVHESELNEWSVVVRLVFGNVSFLFTGDAEAANEQVLLASGKDISADILKSGHHGSDTSSAIAFLRKVAPKTVIISVGADNDYGHPNPDILTRYSEIGAEIYRTDLQGTIVVESDGKTYTISQKSTNTNG